MRARGAFWPSTLFHHLLRHRIQRVEIALLFHQLVEGAGLCDAAVLQDENAVIAAQRRLLQRVRDDNACDAGQGQDIVRDLMRRLRVQRGGGLVGQQDGLRRS